MWDKRFFKRKIKIESSGRQKVVNFIKQVQEWKASSLVKRWNIEIDCYWEILNDFLPDSFPSNSLSYEKNTIVYKNVLIDFFLLLKI